MKNRRKSKALVRPRRRDTHRIGIRRDTEIRQQLESLREEGPARLVGHAGEDLVQVTGRQGLQEIECHALAGFSAPADNGAEALGHERLGGRP